MEKYVSAEIAQRLKVLGFKERVLTYYDNGVPKLYNDITGWDFNTSFMTCVSRPTYSQVLEFFRDNNNLLGGVYSNASGWEWEIHDNIGGTHRFGSDFSGDCPSSGSYTSYEKAELACIEKLLEIVESKSE